MGSSRCWCRGGLVISVGVLRFSCPGCCSLRVNESLIHGCKDCVTHLQIAASALSTRQGTSCCADCRHAAAAGCRVPSPCGARCTCRTNSARRRLMHAKVQHCMQQQHKHCTHSTNPAENHCDGLPSTLHMACSHQPTTKTPWPDTFALLKSGLHATCQLGAAVQRPVHAVPSSLLSQSARRKHTAYKHTAYVRTCRYTCTHLAIAVCLLNY